MLIVEDDPYYFLQFNPYNAKNLRQPGSQSSKQDVAELDFDFVKNLAPSYLKFAIIRSPLLVLLTCCEQI